MKLRLLLLTVLLMLMSSMLVINAQSEDPETPVFTLESQVATMPRRNFQFTDPGAVIYHENTFYMLSNSFNGWPARSSVYLSTSTDGFEFERYDNQPVFTVDDVPYDGFTALPTSVVVTEDGTWILYFYIPENGTNSAMTAIGLATAPEPQGPWTVHESLVIEPGDENAWDSHTVTHPNVVTLDDGYRMYYSGSDNLTNRIGMAFSEDGITWEKYDDPETTDAAFAQSDPVIAELGDPDGDSINDEVWQPNVVRNDDGWVMAFKSGSAFLNNLDSMNLATSEDGITWDIAYGQIIATRRDIQGGRNLWFTNMVQAEDTYYFYHEVGTFDDSVGLATQVYLSTFTGDLISTLSEG